MKTLLVFLLLIFSTNAYTQLSIPAVDWTDINKNIEFYSIGDCAMSKNSNIIITDVETDSGITYYEHISLDSLEAMRLAKRKQTPVEDIDKNYMPMPCGEAPEMDSGANIREVVLKNLELVKILKSL